MANGRTSDWQRKSRRCGGCRTVPRPDSVACRHNIREHSLAALLIRSGFHAVAKAFPFLHDSAFSRPPTSAAAFYGENHEWKGLARYRDTGGKDAMRNPSMKQIEYAKVATILQTPAMDLEYYVDVAGECRLVDQSATPLTERARSFRQEPCHR